ncbi:MAG: hypothetical protein AB2705_12265 [Candidatus Thiodiazotropha sp.]
MWFISTLDANSSASSRGCLALKAVESSDPGGIVIPEWRRSPGICRAFLNQ